MMPHDPTSMPFPRHATFRDPDDTLPRTLAVRAMQTQGQAGAAQGDPTLKAENILLEEFNHASVVAYQAKDELTNLYNLYLITVGVLATGLGVLANTYNSKNAITVMLVEVIVLSIASILSFALYVRRFDIAREYRESMLTMNRIKDYYIQRLASQMPDLPGAFHQRLSARSLKRPLGVGTSIMSVTMALLGGLGVAGVVGQGRQLWAISTMTFAHYTPEITIGSINLSYFWEVVAGLIAIGIHLGYYLVTHRPRG
jgi:hypothetical protein